MTAPQFGKPEAYGIQVGVDPLLVEHAEIVKRAIHTLEYLGEYGIIEDDDSTPSLFVAQSWSDLKRLLKYYVSQGVQVNNLEA